MKLRTAFPLVVIAAWLAAQSLSPAQDKVASSPQTVAEREGRALVDELLSLRPGELILYGVLVRREDSEGRSTQVPMRYTTKVLDDKTWEANYEARLPGKTGVERVVIVHRAGDPNQYHYTKNAETDPVKVARGAEAEVPFAGSDYWLSDLGFEFLHWPEQRTIKHKITTRSTRRCRVLESVNPHPKKESYARVLSWIDVESGALIYAEAYDQNRKHSKTFSLHGFKKVNGQWQATELRMQNDKTDSRSEIRFQFEDKQP